MVIQDWSSVIVTSFQNLWLGAIDFLGKLIGALVVMIVGLIVASTLGAIVERVIELVKLDKLLKGLGIEEYLHKGGLSLNSGKFLGKVVYWFLVIVFLLAAVEILGFYVLSDFLRQILLYIPNVVAASLIMLASFVLANFLRKLVKASVKSANLHGANFLGSLTWWAVVIFGFFASLQQLGVAVSIINTLVIGLVGMIALAGGLAFGLAGKDYASHLIDKFREHLEK